MSPPTIAATSTLAMLRAAEARGSETADILSNAGVTRAYVEDPDARLPAPTVLAIWNALRARTGDPALQLTAPMSLHWGAYRVIDYLVASSATVGHGIDYFARFFRLIADSISLRLEHDAGEHRLVLARADGSPVPPVYVDYVFAALVLRIRMRIQPGLQVKRLELRQAEPSYAAKYRDVFGAPVRFMAPDDFVCFTDEAWNAPTVSADAALASLMEEHARILAARMRQVQPGFRTEVQKAIASTLPEGGSAEHVARKLHISVRTLQRKLVEAGTTFRELYDAVRSQLAEEYLVNPRVSIAEVAFMLGFSDQSAFNRAFRSWTGETPGRWRRQRA